VGIRSSNSSVVGWVQGDWDRVRVIPDDRVKSSQAVTFGDRAPRFDEGVRTTTSCTAGDAKERPNGHRYRRRRVEKTRDVREATDKALSIDKLLLVENGEADVLRRRAAGCEAGELLPERRRRPRPCPRPHQQALDYPLLGSLTTADAESRRWWGLGASSSSSICMDTFRCSWRPRGSQKNGKISVAEARSGIVLGRVLNRLVDAVPQKREAARVRRVAAQAGSLPHPSAAFAQLKHDRFITEAFAKAINLTFGWSSH
jgi:hypothetical protein